MHAATPSPLSLALSSLLSRVPGATHAVVSSSYGLPLARASSPAGVAPGWAAFVETLAAVACASLLEASASLPPVGEGGLGPLSTVSCGYEGGRVVQVCLPPLVLSIGGGVDMPSAVAEAEGKAMAGPLAALRAAAEGYVVGE